MSFGQVENAELSRFFAVTGSPLMPSPHRIAFTAPALLVTTVPVSPLFPLCRPQLPVGGPGNIVGSQKTPQQPPSV
jgi:hypothetical protein